MRAASGLHQQVIHVAHGAVFTMVSVQEAVEDVEGGVAAGQWGLVLAQTRQVIMSCLYIRGLGSGAEPYIYEDSGAFDPCTQVPDDDLRAGLSLIEEACALSAADGEGAADWLDRLLDWVRATEATLGLRERLPELRSPEGMFGALRLVRGWEPLVGELGLPPLLPVEWTTPL